MRLLVRSFALTVSFTLGMSMTAMAAPAAIRAEPIAFSEQVLPFENLSQVMWKPLSTQFPDKFYKLFSVQIAPNGDTVLVDQKGQATVTIRIASVVNSAQTERYVSFQFVTRPSGDFLIEVRTSGSQLIAPPVDEVRLGRLPFYPSADNERFTQVSMSNAIGKRLTFEIAKELVGSEQSIAIIAYDTELGRLLSYRELSTPTYREFTYTLESKQMFGQTYSIGASKRKTPQMFIGTEEFFQNGKNISFSEYQNLFQDTLLRLALNFISF